MVDHPYYAYLKELLILLEQIFLNLDDQNQ